MVIIREYNTITDGFPYAVVRDRIKEYWKNHNGKVLSTKKTKQKIIHIVRILLELNIKIKNFGALICQSILFFLHFTLSLFMLSYFHVFVK